MSKSTAGGAGGSARGGRSIREQAPGYAEGGLKAMAQDSWTETGTPKTGAAAMRAREAWWNESKKSWPKQKPFADHQTTFTNVPPRFTNEREIVNTLKSDRTASVKLASPRIEVDYLSPTPGSRVRVRTQIPTPLARDLFVRGVLVPLNPLAPTSALVLANRD